MDKKEVLQLIADEIGDGEIPKHTAHRKHFVFRASQYLNIDYNHWAFLKRTKPEGFGVLIYPRPSKSEPSSHFVVVPSTAFEQLLSVKPIGKIRWKGESSVAEACWNVRCTMKPRSGEPFLSHGGKQMDIADFVDRADLFEQLILPYWDQLRQVAGKGIFDPPQKACPRCGKSRFPDQGSANVDAQCRNRECRLWFRGEGHPSTARGFFEFDKVNKDWRPFIPTS